jgi:hypothetical protein
MDASDGRIRCFFICSTEDQNLEEKLSSAFPDLEEKPRFETARLASKKPEISQPVKDSLNNNMMV